MPLPSISWSSVGGSMLVVGLALWSPPASAGQSGEWPAYGADSASSKYSPLDQIDRETVHDLRIVWRQSTIPDAVRRGSTVRPSVQSQNTPLMVDGLLYVSTGLGTVAALDATSGDVVWYDTAAAEGEGRGGASRGVAFWRDENGDDARVVAIVGSSLVALNARTGARYANFGDGGAVDLVGGYGYSRARSFGWRSAPLVVRGVIIVGSAVPDVTRSTDPALKEMPPGDVRGFDVRTGEQLWTFHVVPRPGEFGNDTWLTDPNEDRPSWAYSGNTNMWAWPSGDEELGYVYLPLSTPTSDYYGGHRPGNNLFAESLVCIDARTGERIWHFQAVHHGLWDYDFPAAPNLVDITVDGRGIKAVAIVSKQGFTYVFDRITGEPVWPIEERPVPVGDIPGEWYAATQPFPTKPPPFARQGVTEDDLIDYTPELRAEARAILSNYVYGSLFTPPTFVDERAGGTKGTILMPGIVGGADWTGAGVDPETGVLYVSSVQHPKIAGLVRSEHPRSDIEWVPQSQATTEGPRGLPLFKPPYGSLVAIALNVGDILWSVPNGGGPRDHPAIRHLDLPPLGQAGRVAPLVTKSLVFLGEGGREGVVMVPQSAGGKMFRAYDKMTGDVVWEMEFPGGTTAAPMTYMADGTQYIVLTLGWEGMPAEYVALALP